jgi:hypothetical protein
LAIPESQRQVDLGGWLRINPPIDQLCGRIA